MQKKEHKLCHRKKLMKNIFLNRFGRREILKASVYGVALATLSQISFAQSNPDIVVIGAGSAGLSATAELN